MLRAHLKAADVVCMLAMPFLLAGCLQKRLLRMDLAQRERTLNQIVESNTFLSPGPILNSGYDGRIFVAETSLNAFLAGMDAYQIPLESPRHSTIFLEKTRLQFHDGSSDVTVFATATRERWPVTIKVRLDAELLVTASPEEGKVIFTFMIKNVLPDIKLSIFRFREFWFAQSLMRVSAEKYVGALPGMSIDLKDEFQVDLKSRNESITKTNNDRGWIKIRSTSPGFLLTYRYTPIKAVFLNDGVHVFLDLQRISK